MLRVGMMKPAHPPRKFDVALVLVLGALLQDFDAFKEGKPPELIDGQS